MPRAAPGVTSFNGGEVGALMSGRVDFEKYPTTVHRMRRFIPTVQGPAKRCPGTRHVLPVKDSSKRVWQQRFEFAYDDAYILEFGDLYVRFYTDRGVVLEAAQNIVAISSASPGVLEYSGADPSNGDWFYLSGIGGATELNGRYVVVSNVNAGANTFELHDLDGNDIDTTGYGAYTSGGTMQRVYTVASPYALADLTTDEGSCALSIVQSGDVLYIGCPGYQPRTLTRSGAASWAFATYDPSDGPFQRQPDANKTFQLSAATGSVTLTCTSSVFSSAMVGMLIRLEPVNLTTEAWEPGKSIATNDLRKSDGKFYEAQNTKTTGIMTPIHEEGQEYDGDDGVLWKFLHAGYVVLRITAFTSATQVTATVIGPGIRAPAEVVGSNAECRYRIGAWGAATGAELPHKVAFWRDRLWWAGDSNVYASVAGDYASHEPDTLGEILADNAINLTLSVGSVDKIRWLRPSSVLLVGTAGSEVAIREVTTTDPLGPDNIKFELQSAEGSREIGPVLAEDAVVAVRVGGRRINEILYDIQRDAFTPRDLNVLYPEITKSGIVDIAFQKEPDDIIWMVLGDGRLVGLTYDREQNVYGWHQHPMGGTDALVESVQVISSPAGDVDDVWLVVKRTINGVTKRHIEYLAQGLEDGDDIQGAAYLDASLEFDGAVAATLTPGAGATGKGTTGVTFTAGSSVFVAGDVGREIRVRYYDDDDEQWLTSRAEITGYTSGTVVTCDIISAFQSTAAIASGGWRMTADELRGLYHLEGETVTALADGQTVENLTVTDGVVTLTDPAARVQVGLPYDSVLATQRIEAGSGTGTAQGQTKRIHRLMMRLYASLGGKFGPDLDNLDEIIYRRGSDYMDEVPPVLTGDTDSLAFPGGYETDGRIWIVCDQPLPMTVVALYPILQEYDR